MSSNLPSHPLRQHLLTRHNPQPTFIVPINHQFRHVEFHRQSPNDKAATKTLTSR